MIQATVGTVTGSEIVKVKKVTVNCCVSAELCSCTVWLLYWHVAVDRSANCQYRPPIPHIPTAYQNSGTNSFRPVFPKSVHKASVYKTICSIDVTLLMDKFADRHENCRYCADLMEGRRLY